MRIHQFLSSLLLPGVLLAQFDKPGTNEVQDQPGLPRVLLIGDSISGGYGPVVRERLKGKANIHSVHREKANGDTNNGMDEIDAWLSRGRWDIIHFNWGLWDLKVKEDGRNVVPIEQYAKNMRELVTRLKQTRALLIFATTTPVPDPVMTPKRRTTDVLLYNAVARKIMEEEQVFIDDLYAVALPHLAEIQWPNDVHFAPRGNEILGERVTTCILYLSGRVKPKI
jgi:lysophospholipase L1-like esterase